MALGFRLATISLCIDLSVDAAPSREWICDPQRQVSSTVRVSSGGTAWCDTTGEAIFPEFIAGDARRGIPAGASPGSHVGAAPAGALPGSQLP
jgi:hypothetical protein